MFLVNKNNLLNELREVVVNNLSKPLDYMPNSFNEEQLKAIELFKSRVFLEEIVEETVSFNRSINWQEIFPALKLLQNPEELIDIYKLRSDVYGQMGYHTEFPDPIESLNFDIFDKTSAIVYYERNKEITATCRLIFDSQNKLPSEEKFSYDEYRKKYKVIGEISRNMVRNRMGLNREFKYLMAGMHTIAKHNKLDMFYSVILKDHLSLFKKFGEVEVIKEFESYGTFNQNFVIIQGNPQNESNIFERSILK